jgi:hypothetical protein
VTALILDNTTTFLIFDYSLAAVIVYLFYLVVNRIINDGFRRQEQVLRDLTLKMDRLTESIDRLIVLLGARCSDPSKEGGSK